MAEQIDYAYAGDIVKAERDAAGNLMVFGKATGSDMDLDEQYADPEWLKSAMPDWAKWGNLREMHQPIVAGIGRETTSDESGNWFLKSEVVDAGTAKKIEAGALKGYSIGIKNARVVKDAKAPGGRIVGGTIVEVSYVDRPCNPTSTIGIAKMVGAELAAVESETPGTAWLAKKVVKPADTDKAATIDSLFARIDSLEKALKKPGASGTGKDSSGKSIADVPDEDFAGPNGTFPIRQPADVADAASLAHHADDPAAVRAKIKAIAKRKFAMKGKDMPPSLKKDKTVTAKKSAAPDKSIKKLVKAAVAESTAALTARAEAAEQKLAEISKTVQPGGPRPMGYAPKTNEAAAQQARVDRFKRLASSTSDRELSKGYEELAKKAEADLTK